LPVELIMCSAAPFAALHFFDCGRFLEKAWSLVRSREPRTNHPHERTCYQKARIRKTTYSVCNSLGPNCCDFFDSDLDLHLHAISECASNTAHKHLDKQIGVHCGRARHYSLGQEWSMREHCRKWGICELLWAGDAWTKDHLNGK